MPATLPPTAPHPGRARRAAPTTARRRTVAVGATALALVLGLGACGTSAGEKADAQTTVAAKPTTTTTVAEETTTTVAADDDPILHGDIPVDDPTDPIDDPDEPTDPVEDPDQPEDVDILNRLEHINIAIDDLPAGWEAEPADPTEAGIIEACASNAGEQDLLFTTRSDSFSLTDPEAGGGLGLDAGSGWMADEAVADDLMDELKTDEFAACASDQLLTTDDPSVTVEGTFQPAEIEAELGDDVAVLQGDFTMSDAEQTIQVSGLVITIRTGQVITTVTASAINVPGDEQLLYGLLDLVAQRQAETA